MEEPIDVENAMLSKVGKHFERERKGEGRNDVREKTRE